MSLQGLHYPRLLFWSIHHSVLLGRMVARCHVADAGAVTLAIVIHEVEETGGSIARHSHEFGCERGRREHPSEPLGVCVHEGCEAIGELVVWWLRLGPWGSTG